MTDAAATEAATEAAIRAVWSFESARLVGRLARAVRDVALADELAQGALAAALATWPTAGAPADPAAWLLAATKLAVATDGATDGTDDVLPLLFVACHPSLGLEARVELTLRLIAGLSTPEIARALGAPEPAIAARLAAALRELAAAQVAVELPRTSERDARLADVLEVIYIIFNEGYGAADADLCERALRLALIVAQLMPSAPEPHGLVALMALHMSRADARRGPEGQPIQLLEQDRARWDAEMVTRGLAALQRAEEAGPRGPFVIQAAISACHARAKSADDTEWSRIAMLYGKLAELDPSPGIELNRAVAVAMAYGPAKGLEIVDALVAQPHLAGFHLLASARADLLAKLGRYAEARAEFTRAAELTPNPRERQLLLASAAACVAGT